MNIIKKQCKGQGGELVYGWVQDIELRYNFYHYHGTAFWLNVWEFGKREERYQEMRLVRCQEKSLAGWCTPPLNPLTLEPCPGR